MAKHYKANWAFPNRDPSMGRGTTAKRTAKSRVFVDGGQTILGVKGISVVSFDGEYITEQIYNPNKLVWFLVELDLPGTGIKERDMFAMGIYKPRRAIITQLNKYWYPVYAGNTVKSLSHIEWDHINLTTGDKEHMASRVKDFIQL